MWEYPTDPQFDDFAITASAEVFWRPQIALKCEAFAEAAHEPGMSRRYSGIHFESADFVGRELGRIVADQVWMSVRGYFDGGHSRVKHKTEPVSA